jgi:hypothetical protein
MGLEDMRHNALSNIELTDSLSYGRTGKRGKKNHTETKIPIEHPKTPLRKVPESQQSSFPSLLLLPHSERDVLISTDTR